MPRDKQAIDPIRLAIADHLRALIHAAGGASEVAAALGTSRQAVSAWGAGYRLPPPEQWPEIASALGVTDYRNIFPPPDKIPEKRQHSA